MHCSGLVKHVRATGDLITGHTTFNDYQFMLRVYKTYDFSKGRGGASYPGAVSSFSSRPGDLHSKDDFYALSSGLSVLETSLTVFDKSIYGELSPRSVPCWARVHVANRAAATADGWASIFGEHNSGTHNNQWIATDYKRLPTSGGALPPNTAWMLEQMPGKVVAEDVTDVLAEDTFLYSINIPKFEVIFDLSGYNETAFNYTTDVRAQMFRRD